MDDATNVCKDAIDICKNVKDDSNKMFDAVSIVLKLDLYEYVDLITRWRDSIPFVKEHEQREIIKVLVRTVTDLDTPSIDKLYTAVQLYNTGFIDVCYNCFIVIIFDSKAEIRHKLEVAKFLYAANVPKYKTIVLQFLIDFIQDFKFPEAMRYSVIQIYNNRRGIRTATRMQTLIAPVDQSFLCALQYVFCFDKNNTKRARIISAQHLLQMDQPEVISNEKHLKVEEFVLSVALNDRDYNTRADAADIILRLGTPENRVLVKTVIQELGLLRHRDGLTPGLPKVVYENAQNVHTEAVDLAHKEVLGKLVNLTTGDELYENSNIEIINKVNANPKIKEKGKIFSSLSRIDLDTSVFGYNENKEERFNLKEILARIWEYMNLQTPAEFKFLFQRLLDELIDMNQTCASGHTTRLLNILPFIVQKISWLDQIRGNVKGRIMSYSRDDPDIEDLVSIGIVSSHSSEEYRLYIEWLADAIEDIKDELYPEYVVTGLIETEKYDEYFKIVKNEWSVTIS